MTDEKNQGMSRERAAELVDAMSRTELIDYVQSTFARTMELVASVNEWAEAKHAAAAQRDEFAAALDRERATVERLVDEKHATARAVFEALDENARGVILDEHGESVREELRDELRDELREEVQEECAEEVRDAFDRIGWL
jgi:hypothetical protein